MSDTNPTPPVPKIYNAKAEARRAKALALVKRLEERQRRIDERRAAVNKIPPQASASGPSTVAPILALLLGLGVLQLRADDADWLQPKGPIPAVVVEQTGGLVITTASPDPVVPLVPLGNGQAVVDPSSSARSGTWDTPDIKIHSGSDR